MRTDASDFVVIVSAACLEDDHELMDRMMADNPNVRKYVSSVVLQTFKRALFTPLAASAR